MRSSSVVGLFLGLKFNVAKLDFGYKGYRSVINQRLPLEMEKIKLITLYGKTGTGKTEVLHNLKLLGADILDLEGCANHRGSILGSIGKSQPNSQKQFEGLVFDTLIKRKTDVLFTEGESKRIGKVVMQDFMYNKLLSSYKIFVEAPLDFRVNVIEKDYINADFKQSDLLNGIEKLKRYMSNEKAEKLLENIKVENYKNVIEDLMVNYYDLNYSCKDKVFDETVVNTDSYQLANKILSNHIM